MTTALPSANTFTDPGVTEAQFKTQLTLLHDYLAGLLGTDGSAAAAQEAMSVPAVGNLGNTDLNAVLKSGLYRFQTPSANGPGFSYGQLIVVCGPGSDTIAQIAIDYQTGILYSRGGSPSSIGGTGSWTSWQQVGATISLPLSQANGGTGQTSASAALSALGGAPIPHAGSGIGQWVLINNTSTLPSGGTWVYFVVVSGGAPYAGVAAGGTVFGNGLNNVTGFAWSIA